MLAHRPRPAVCTAPGPRAASHTVQCASPRCSGGRAASWPRAARVARGAPAAPPAARPRRLRRRRAGARVGGRAARGARGGGQPRRVLAVAQHQGVPWLRLAHPEERRVQPHGLLALPPPLLLGLRRRLGRAQLGDRRLLPLQPLRASGRRRRARRRQRALGLHRRLPGQDPGASPCALPAPGAASRGLGTREPAQLQGALLREGAPRGWRQPR